MFMLFSVSISIAYFHSICTSSQKPFTWKMKLIAPSVTYTPGTKLAFTCSFFFVRQYCYCCGIFVLAY